MKKIKILLFVIVSILLSFSYNQKVFAFDDPVGAWVLNSNFLPGELAGHASFGSLNKLFTAGGATTDDFKEVYKSSTASNGSVSVWDFENNLPETRYGMAKAVKNNQFYILGGLYYDGTPHYVNNVYLSRTNMVGDLSAWQEVSSLPQNLVGGESVVVGDRIYFAGGVNNDGSSDEIYTTNISLDGTLGSWTLVGHLPHPLATFGMLNYKNRIYIIGGNTNGSIRQEVYSASINQANGSVGVWRPELSLIQPYADSDQVIIVGNVILAVGGTSSFVTSKVYYTKIKTDGSFSGWLESVHSLPEPVTSGSIVYENGYLYLIGGNNGVNRLKTVYYSKLNLESNLSVPLLKQRDPAWSSQLYDSADLWASAGQRGIGNWGCGITSAAMVFQYNKITKLPDGSTLDPKSLNTWLRGRKLGYIKEGWVNWAELAVLSKLAKNKNPEFTHDTLEYKYTIGENNTLLNDDLENKIPDILEEPGHFVVAKGTDGFGGFTINDPYYDRTNLSSYGNTFSKLIRFVPSNSDLSYIILAAEGNTNISLKNNSGIPVGDTFLQDPLIDDVGGQAKNGGTVRFTQFAQPETGTYKIEITSQASTKYSLDIILYDIKGNGKKITLTGVTGPTDADIYSITFNKENINNSTTQKIITFDSLISDLNALCASREIKIICPALIAQVKTAKDAASFKPTVNAAKSLLKAVDNQIGSQKRKNVSQSAYDIIHLDLQILISNL